MCPTYGSDNVLNTPGLMDPSTEFGSIMQHAMKIKGAQMEQDRKKFETWPTFLQNSMWERNEESLRLRALPVSERLAGAATLYAPLSKQLQPRRQREKPPDLPGAADATCTQAPSASAARSPLSCRVARSASVSLLRLAGVVELARRRGPAALAPLRAAEDAAVACEAS